MSKKKDSSKMKDKNVVSEIEYNKIKQMHLYESDKNVDGVCPKCGEQKDNLYYMGEFIWRACFKCKIKIPAGAREFTESDYISERKYFNNTYRLLKDLEEAETWKERQKDEEMMHRAYDSLMIDMMEMSNLFLAGVSIEKIKEIYIKRHYEEDLIESMIEMGKDVTMNKDGKFVDKDGRVLN